MHIVSLSDGPGYDRNRLIAEPLIEGSQSNVRIIRLSPAQALPPHRHGSSDLMLFAVEGEGVLETDGGPVAFGAGSLACYRGDVELRISNEGLTPVSRCWRSSLRHSRLDPRRERRLRRAKSDA